MQPLSSLTRLPAIQEGKLIYHKSLAGISPSGRDAAMILGVKPLLIVVERTMVRSEPHAGAQAGVAGLLVVVPKPPIKRKGEVGG